MKRKVFFAVLASLTIGLLAACSTEKNDGKNSTSVSKENSESLAESSSAEEENTKDSADDSKENKDTSNSEKEKEETIYNIGDSAALKDWEITLSDMKIVESISADYVSYKPDEAGNQYAQVFVTVANNGKEAASFLPSFGFDDDVSVKLLFGDGYEFIASNLMGYEAEMHNATINPLSSQSGEIAFAIPETVVNSEDEIIIQFKSGDDTLKFKVR